MSLIFKLDPKVKKIWTDALKSGLYEQGKENLHSDGKYCCLGVAVACKLATEKDNKDQYTNEDFLPLRIQLRLAELNDNGQSFDEIANYIDEIL